MKIEDAIKQSKFKNEYEKLVVNILYTAGWIELEISRIFKEYGITIQQYNILRILRGQYPKPATINMLIGRMIDKNVKCIATGRQIVGQEIGSKKYLQK